MSERLFLMISDKQVYSEAQNQSKDQSKTIKDENNAKTN